MRSGCLLLVMTLTRGFVVLSVTLVAPLVAVTGWAAASGTQEHPLSVLPNPSFVGERLIAGGGQSPETACEGDLVELQVQRAGQQVLADDAQPNSTGGWSIELPRLEAGSYEVTATCSRGGELVFAYDPTTLVVQAPEPPAASPSPSAPVAPAPVASPVPGTPSFTG